MIHFDVPLPLSLGHFREFFSRIYNSWKPCLSRHHISARFVRLRESVLKTQIGTDDGRCSSSKSPHVCTTPLGFCVYSLGQSAASHYVPLGCLSVITSPAENLRCSNRGSSRRIATIAATCITHLRSPNRHSNLIPNPHIHDSSRLPKRILSRRANRPHLTRRIRDVVPRTSVEIRSRHTHEYLARLVSLRYRKLQAVGWVASVKDARIGSIGQE